MIEIVSEVEMERWRLVELMEFYSGFSGTEHLLSELYRAIGMDSCPFNQGTGTCQSGCRAEPACHTEAPGADGWVTEIRTRAAEVADAARYEARRRQGQHGRVKHLRDLARWADKLSAS